MDKRYYLCLSQRQAGYLMLKGFKLKRVQANEKDTKKNMFIFYFTEEIMREVEVYNVLRKERGIEVGL